MSWFASWTWLQLEKNAFALTIDIVLEITEFYWISWFVLKKTLRRKKNVFVIAMNLNRNIPCSLFYIYLLQCRRSHWDPWGSASLNFGPDIGARRVDPDGSKKCWTWRALPDIPWEYIFSNVLCRYVPRRGWLPQ
jgi:hypothetical protein